MNTSLLPPLKKAQRQKGSGGLRPFGRERNIRAWRTDAEGQSRAETAEKLRAIGVTADGDDGERFLALTRKERQHRLALVRRLMAPAFMSVDEFLACKRGGNDDGI